MSDTPAREPEDAIDAAVQQSAANEKPLTAFAQLTRDPEKTITITVPRDFMAEDCQAIMEMTLQLLQAAFEVRQREQHHGIELPKTPKLLTSIRDRIRPS